MTCTSDIEVIGNGFVISININELDNIDQATKDQLQSTYDSMDSSFESLLVQLQTEVPEIEYFKINVNEVDGDSLAVISVGNK